ncbi:MAG: 16S rRNA (cytidine(1402)-2'-O)-methyltransferase [Candidatus Omnitrophica bacterium]|nr:16S rRNA (cytidine(1402)-2'-O)-methyltransferase [Candidatus Omnitrophota bacterium]
MPGKLYIVATPIGNLEDITIRAIRILKEVSFIACEDTRRTKILCNAYGIETPLISYYSYNEHTKKDVLINYLEQGKDIALVSDAGTPGISDPGYVLINAAIEKGFDMEAIPGPTALINALSISGKPTNKFVYEGFLSNKSSQRRKRLEQLKDEQRTIVFYESCHRIVKMLTDIFEIRGDIEIVCAREMTKKFEEIHRTKVSNIIEVYKNKKPKGEFVVII